MAIKLFIKDDCPRCPAARKTCEGFNGVEVFNVGEIVGSAEAHLYGVLSTPSVLVVDDVGREVAGWRGHAPERARLRMYEELKH